MKPNFLVVGAAKCGTTSLNEYLKQHPDVFLPKIKESRYFSNINAKKLNPFTSKEHDVAHISIKKDYYSLFEGSGDRVKGDVSPDYLYYYSETIKNIHMELGRDVKIIIILRNPAERAYSNYMHLRREGLTDRTFDEVIDLESGWDKNKIWYGFYVINPGYYFDPVKCYLDNFDNVKVLIFEDFIEDVEGGLKDICNFLGVPSFDFKKPSFINKTGLIRSVFVKKIMEERYPLKSKLRKLLCMIFGEDNLLKVSRYFRHKNMVKPKLNEELKSRLLELYHNDIVNLEKLIGKDLSMWKKTYNTI